MLCTLQRILPNASIGCITSHPDELKAEHKVAAIPIEPVLARGWLPRNRFLGLARKIFIGVPGEINRWVYSIKALRNTDMVIVVGTGLLTDAYCLKSWGPYGTFRWALAARICGARLLFVSVGAGPLDSQMGKWLVKASLAMAHFRSYRDTETKEYLASIGAGAPKDSVYPDLAFSIVEEREPPSPQTTPGRRVVGVGLMLYHAKLSSDKLDSSTYEDYLTQLVEFSKWLIACDYDIRVLMGDLADRSVVEEFKVLLKEQLGAHDHNRIIDEPIDSFGTLIRQIASTDFVVATRFHNVLWALALNKPAISIAFHQKCTSLMKGMGMSEYCQDIRGLEASRLIGQFCHLEANASSIKERLAERVVERRKLLDEQYRVIFEDFLPDARGCPSCQ